MITLWNTIVFEPLYNGLVFLIDIIPGGDVGFAIILLTLLVKLILAPLSRKSIKSQLAMKELQPELDAIKKKHKDDKQEQAKQTFEIYKKRKVNPFSGCIVLIIQIPIILALYSVFLKGLDFNPDILYSFVAFPTQIQTVFLGLFDLATRSIPLALLTGISQFILLRYSKAMSFPKKSEKDDKNESMGSYLQKSMQSQMRYALPLIVTFVSYTLPSAVALYWTTSNVFALVQEYLLRKNDPKESLVLEKK